MKAKMMENGLEYLKEHCPIRLNNLILSGQLWTYLADFVFLPLTRRSCEI